MSITKDPPPGRVLCERLSALLVYSVIVIVLPVLFHQGGLMYKSSVQYTEYALLLAYLLFFVIVCFTSYIVFRIAVLPHSPGVVYYHLFLRQETRIPRVAPFSFRIGIWDLFVHRGQKSYTPTAFWQLWITPGVRCIKSCIIIIHKPSMRPGLETNQGPLD